MELSERRNTEASVPGTSAQKAFRPPGRRRQRRRGGVAAAFVPTAASVGLPGIVRRTGYHRGRRTKPDAARRCATGSLQVRLLPGRPCLANVWANDSPRPASRPISVPDSCKSEPLVQSGTRRVALGLIARSGAASRSVDYLNDVDARGDRDGCAKKTEERDKATGAIRDHQSDGRRAPDRVDAAFLPFGPWRWLRGADERCSDDRHRLDRAIARAGL